MELGCYLVDIGLFFHVCQEHRLKDDMLFYRFTVSLAMRLRDDLMMTLHSHLNLGKLEIGSFRN